MKPSAIKLLGLRYTTVKIIPQLLEEFDNQDFETFDFEGVEIGEDSQIFPLDENNSTLFGVMFKFIIENTGGKICPYDIEFSAIGHFKVSKKIPENKRKEFVIVNGCSIIYGAIREQVMTITARSIHGILILPVAHFLDKLEQSQENEETLDPKKST